MLKIFKEKSVIAQIKLKKIASKDNYLILCNKILIQTYEIQQKSE